MISFLMLLIFGLTIDAIYQGPFICRYSEWIVPDKVIECGWIFSCLTTRYDNLCLCRDAKGNVKTHSIESPYDALSIQLDCFPNDFDTSKGWNP